MSESKVYKVKVNGSEYGADDKASAEALAELLGGEVFTVSKQEAISHVRAITKTDPIPSRFADFVADVGEMLDVILEDGECWQLTVRRDKKADAWYRNMKDETLDGPVYDENGAKFDSYAAARWEYGQKCNVQYLKNGIRKAGNKSLKFGKSKPKGTA